MILRARARIEEVEYTFLEMHRSRMERLLRQWRTLPPRRAMRLMDSCEWPRTARSRRRPSGCGLRPWTRAGAQGRCRSYGREQSCIRRRRCRSHMTLRTMRRRRCWATRRLWTSRRVQSHRRAAVHMWQRRFTVTTGTLLHRRRRRLPRVSTIISFAQWTPSTFYRWSTRRPLARKKTTRCAVYAAANTFLCGGVAMLCGCMPAISFKWSKSVSHNPPSYELRRFLVCGFRPAPQVMLRERRLLRQHCRMSIPLPLTALHYLVHHVQNLRFVVDVRETSIASRRWTSSTAALAQENLASILHAAAIHSEEATFRPINSSQA